MSSGAFTGGDSGKRVPWEGRGDFGSVGVGSCTGRKAVVGRGRRVISARGRGREISFGRGREAGRRRRRRDGAGSHKGDKGKSRDDFELHIVLFVVILLRIA